MNPTSAAGPADPSENLFDLLRAYRPRLNFTVSPNDQMVLPQEALDADTLPETDWRNQYFWVAEEILRLVVKAMILGEKTTLRRILDLPCGHGRATRAFRAAFPDADITVCDIDRDGVDFCAREFAARPVYGHPDPDRIELGDETFDLIYCGSLLTHLDADRFRRFVWMMSRHLAKDGLLVFTTHGRWCITFHRTVSAFIAPEPWQVIEDGFRREGFGYHDYAESPGYGVSLSTLGWVQQVVDADPSLTTLAAMEKALGNFQDAFVCQKWPIDNLYGPAHPKVRPMVYRGEVEMNGPPPATGGPRMVSGLAPELQKTAEPVAEGPPPTVETAAPSPPEPQRSWAGRLRRRLWRRGGSSGA
ncbi:hypothetical protein STVA_20000 [Allostella vacuolata]|nr:hypothetical protein STVA_20000 [Stella vacuolata]